MSGASAPRQTGLWQDTLIAARTVIEDRASLPQGEVDALAEAVAERLLGDFLALAEAGSEMVFTADGRGPVCSWCGQLGGPKLSPGHPQYGVFCTCRREVKPGRAAAEAVAEAA